MNSRIDFKAVLKDIKEFEKSMAKIKEDDFANGVVLYHAMEQYFSMLADMARKNREIYLAGSIKAIRNKLGY